MNECLSCLPDTLLVPVVIPVVLFLHADSDDILIHVHLDIALAHAWQVCPYFKVSLILEGQHETERRRCRVLMYAA